MGNGIPDGWFIEHSGESLILDQDKVADELRRLRAALTFIAGMKDMTLIAPSLGSDGDKGHQLGAVKAFNQCADAAAAALQPQLTS